MNRPYTICYLNLSAEGHIDGEFMKSPAAAQTTEVFRQRWLEMGADAILYGAVTMAMFAQGRLKEPLPEKGPLPRQDYKAPCSMDRYYIAMDPKGSIAYEGPCIDTRGRGPHGVIHVLTENVADSYLHYLREKGISYIFCGKEKLDPVTMIEKAHSLFGLQKVILSGGAYTDWTLLSQGLIDELQFMLAPVVDGNPEAHTLFRRMPGMEPGVVELELVGAETVAGDGLLITYRPKNARENAGMDKGGLE